MTCALLLLAELFLNHKAPTRALTPKQPYAYTQEMLLEKGRLRNQFTSKKNLVISFTTVASL